jgi:hypothetical protein
LSQFMIRLIKIWDEIPQQLGACRSKRDVELLCRNEVKLLN